MKKIMILAIMAVLGLGTMSAEEVVADSVKHKCVMPEKVVERTTSYTEKIIQDGQIVIKVVDQEKKIVSFYDMKGQLIKREVIY